MEFYNLSNEGAEGIQGNHYACFLLVGWPYVPFLGLGPGVPPSLPLCPGIFNSKFAFVNTVCQRYTNEPFVILY